MKGERLISPITEEHLQFCLYRLFQFCIKVIEYSRFLDTPVITPTRIYRFIVGFPTVFTMGYGFKDIAVYFPIKVQIIGFQFSFENLLDFLFHLF